MQFLSSRHKCLYYLDRFIQKINQGKLLMNLIHQVLEVQRLGIFPPQVPTISMGKQSPIRAEYIQFSIGYILPIDILGVFNKIQFYSLSYFCIVPKSYKA